MSERLSGAELETWYKNFAQSEGIEAHSIPSAGKVVTAINRHIPERLKRAMPHIVKYIPDGWEQVNALQDRPKTILPKDKDAKLSNYLLDKAVATDQLIELKNNSGQFVRIAVDVTGNPTKLQEKIDRIQGFPEPNDALGKNRNLNFSEARKELGIDKHLILALNSQRDKLPSHEKLLTEMQTFANAPERTRLTDLQNVQPSELFYAEPRFLKDPQRLLNIYLANTTQKKPGDQLVEIATQALQDGHPKERVEAILLIHPFLDEYRQKNQLPTAQKLAGNIYENQAKALQKTSQAAQAKPEITSTLKSWPQIASALGKPKDYQDWVQSQTAGGTDKIGDRAFKQDLSEYQKSSKKLQDWQGVAKVLGKPKEYLGQISSWETGFKTGQPLPKEATAKLETDFNQVRYQQLTKKLPEKQQSLQGVAAAALELGYSPKQVTGILSAAPKIKEIRKQDGEAASQIASKQALQEGLKINNAKQSTNQTQQTKRRPRQR